MAQFQFNDQEFGEFTPDQRKQLRRYGRPRVFTTPEEMGLAVDRYLNLCISHRTPPTYTGMILALGLSSKLAFRKYREYEGYAEEVDRAELLIEHEYEKRLNTATSATAPIFALKQFGWRDKTEHELTGANGGPVHSITTTMTPEELAQTAATVLAKF